MNNESYNIAKQYYGGDLVSNHPNNKAIREASATRTKKRWEEKSEEDRRLFSEGRKGNLNSNYGNRWSDKSRAQLSQKRKGVNNHPATGKTFEEVYGQEKANQIRQKLSDLAKTRTGERNSFYGKRHSEELINTILKTKKEKYPDRYPSVIIFGKLYDGISQASRELSISFNTIKKRLKDPNYPDYLYKCPTTISKESTSQAIGDGNGNESLYRDCDIV